MTLHRQRWSAALAPWLLAGCAAQSLTAAVPDKLRGAPNEVLAMIVPAKGVQIYECRPRRELVGAFEWFFVAPEADLFDRGGAKIGRHYAGPHWEANDGSKLLGTVKERAEAPAAGAIPWLLLSARSVGKPGAFAGVTSIQRVNTVGGSAPQNGCTPSSSGAQVRVPYTADYNFLAPK